MRSRRKSASSTRSAPHCKTIGFIGLGLMGRAFSKNLLQDGYRVVGTDPSPSARRRFKAIGGFPLPTPREVAEMADILFISVPNSKISLQTARGKDGYLCFGPGKAPEVVIDTTTADPKDSRRHAKLCEKKGIPYLDGCVSGNSHYVSRREGLFLVGGDERAYRKAAPLLAEMLSDHVHCGPSKSGAMLKVAVNYLTSIGRCLIAETLRLGLNCGFSKEFFLDALLRSRAGGWAQLRHQGPRMIRGRFLDPVSTVDVLAKDIQLGLKLSRRVGSRPLLGSTCLPLYKEALAAGYGPLDSTAVYNIYEKRENRKPRGKARQDSG